MNASLRLFVTDPLALRRLRVGAAAGCLVLAAGLSGCASNPFTPSKLDHSSAAAGQITTLTNASKAYPSFADIPPAPADVRPDRAWGKAAAEIEADGQALAAATAPGSWSLSGTDTFASRAQAAAGPSVEGSTTAATEAFAKQARQRATPPPPPKK
jgi:hypothetical protein